MKKSALNNYTTFTGVKGDKLEYTYIGRGKKCSQRILKNLYFMKRIQKWAFYGIAPNF